MRENRLRWFGHMQRKPITALIRKSDRIIGLAGGLNELWMGRLKKDVLSFVLLRRWPLTKLNGRE